MCRNNSCYIVFIIVVPIVLMYNIVMLNMKKEDMKKDLVIEMNMIGEWFSRGERGIDEWCESVNVDKIRKVWDESDGEDYDDGVLNVIEERILVGDGGFIWDDDEDYSNSKRGISGCMSRVDDLLEGKSIIIEMEESLYCIGIESELNKVEVDYMKYKIELMKG